MAYEIEDSLTALINDILERRFMPFFSFYYLIFCVSAVNRQNYFLSIKQIRVFTRSIASGDYPEKLKSTTKDEFEKLVTDLNIMNEMLQKRENDLLELNRDLEQRVELRTAELKETAEL
ncbi:MAG: hypothetical protein IPG53_08085 [Ignavibacteriales bacterium]|nr:hypothetical protein [Ignavibacteriales bacterium]